MSISRNFHLHSCLPLPLHLLLPAPDIQILSAEISRTKSCASRGHKVTVRGQKMAMSVGRASFFLRRVREARALPLLSGGRWSSFYDVNVVRWKSSSPSATAGKEGFEELDKPIQFTTSKAASWRASDTLGGGPKEDGPPEIQMWSVLISVSAFLLYFLWLREENDVDERMKQPLWERIPGLEIQQLQTLIHYNQEKGLPTQDLQARLDFLLLEQKKQKLKDKQ